MTEHDLMTVAEAAKIMRVQPDTVYTWIRTGVWREPLVVRVNRTIRIRRILMERTIANGGKPEPDQPSAAHEGTAR
jgi:excisionase family DNA binding protein